MKKVSVLFMILALNCSDNKQQLENKDRFSSNFTSMDEIALIEQITNDGKCLFPSFAEGDSIIMFKRLLVNAPEDTFGRAINDMVKNYGINIATKELYNIGGIYDYPRPLAAEPESLKPKTGEIISWAAELKEKGLLAYESYPIGNPNQSNIYLLKNNILEQLSVGPRPVYLDRISNSGRFLSAIYGDSLSRIILYDILNENRVYVIKGFGFFVDYMTSFSSTDSMMVFIRSNQKFAIGTEPFGDIFLVRFRH